MLRRDGIIMSTLIVLLLVGILLISSNVKKEITPKVSGTINDTFIVDDNLLSFDFNGYFHASVHKYFNYTIIWVTPKEGVKIKHIRVTIDKQIMNGLFMEVEPPQYGNVIITNNDIRNGVEYNIEVNPLKFSGEGTCEIKLIDKVPDKQYKIRIYVEVEDGFKKYYGKTPEITIINS